MDRDPVRARREAALEDGRITRGSAEEAGDEEKLVAPGVRGRGPLDRAERMLPLREDVVGVEPGRDHRLLVPGGRGVEDLARGRRLGERRDARDGLPEDRVLQLRERRVQKASGRVSAAAELLKLPRSTLRSEIEKYGLDSTDD